MKQVLIIITIIALFAAACASGEANKPVLIEKKLSSYDLVAIKKAGVPSRVKLPSVLAAYQQVSIFPKVNAYVKNVWVDIGDRVKPDQLLMTLEAPELQQATMRAKEKYARAKADFSIDKEHYQRLLEAAATPGAVSALDISTIRSKMDADSALCNAEKNNWLMQAEMETYLTVKAPFAGVITERNVYPGALVNAASKDRPMLELKEIRRLRLQADVPEGLASTLKINDTISFITSALPGKKITGRISRKSMNVDPKFRSERIEIDVDNKDELLTPGMYAELLVHSNGNASAFTAPSSAVITSTERKYLWTVENGKAKKTDVATGNSANGKTEVYGELGEGMQVITDPNDDLREGQTINE